MYDRPRAIFIVNPFPCKSDSLVGQIIYSLDVVNGASPPMITFNHRFRRCESWAGFDIHPVSERTYELFQDGPSPSALQKAQESGDIKGEPRAPRWQQLYELSKSPWRLRCRPLQRSCVQINENCGIMVAEVLKVYSRRNEQVHYGSFRWRRIKQGYYSTLDAFTPERFLERLVRLQKKFDYYKVVLSQISNRPKKQSQVMGQGQVTEQSQVTEQNQTTEQSQLTKPERNLDPQATEIVLDIEFNAEDGQIRNISTTVPIVYR